MPARATQAGLPMRLRLSIAAGNLFSRCGVCRHADQQAPSAIARSGVVVCQNTAWDHGLIKEYDEVPWMRFVGVHRCLARLELPAWKLAMAAYRLMPSAPSKQCNYMIS
jgi:hypothetical protein